MSANRFAKISSIIAILLSIAGLVYAGFSFFNREPEERLFRYVWGLIGWCLLWWGSIISFLTCRKCVREDLEDHFFSYLFCGIGGILVCYMLEVRACLVFAPIIFSQILDRKKKIIQKYQYLQEENRKE